MDNLIDLQNQIEKLQKQAAEIKKREYDRTVQDIRAKMHAFGISLKDIQEGKSTKSGKLAAAKSLAGSKRRVSKSLGTKVPPKYKSPAGDTWTGRGVMPRWMSSLLAEGRAKEDFLIRS